QKRSCGFVVGTKVAAFAGAESDKIAANAIARNFMSFVLLNNKIEIGNDAARRETTRVYASRYRKDRGFIPAEMERQRLQGQMDGSDAWRRSRNRKSDQY